VKVEYEVTIGFPGERYTRSGSFEVDSEIDPEKLRDRINTEIYQTVSRQINAKLGIPNAKNGNKTS